MFRKNISDLFVYDFTKLDELKDVVIIPSKRLRDSGKLGRKCLK